jgi:hypothetical protein
MLGGHVLGTAFAAGMDYGLGRSKLLGAFDNFAQEFTPMINQHASQSKHSGDAIHPLYPQSQ